MKILVCGSRHFSNTNLFMDVMLFMYQNHNDFTIISGCAQGPDTWAINFAKSRKINLIEMPADWPRYGRSAGIIRNRQMLEIATHVIAFHDGHSRGTLYTINQAKKMKLPLAVYHNDSALF